MILEHFSYPNVGENLELYLYCALLRNQELQERNLSEVIEYLLNTYDKSHLSDVLERLKNSSVLLSFNSIAGIYSQAVGEMGISPAYFYYKTQQEIEWAFQEYRNRQELAANLTQLAIKNNLEKNTDYIELKDEREYQMGTQQEREETFKNLGVEV